MILSNALLESRLAVAWKNIRANRHLRPVDMINGYQMVQPLRELRSQPVSPLVVPQVVYDLLTRLLVTYEPRPVTPPARYPVHQTLFSFNKEPRVGLFADAPDHLSGVCQTLGEWKHQADLAGRDLIVHGCGSAKQHVVSFEPIGSINMGAYEGLTLNIPRVPDVLNYVKRMAFDVIHVSTPGPMGLLGLLAARQFGIPVCGTYHTDFPRYAATLSGDPNFEQVGWVFMRWFYGQLDRVAAPTRSIQEELINHGIDRERIHIVGRGVETNSFSPSMRCEAWRRKHGASCSVKLLYVGRISKEKNLEDLAHAFRQLRKTRPDICLVIVGDGPYREELMRQLEGLPVYFTGVLKEKALARAYASCDLFVFPSKTDTYGRVVLEAQASGLPVVVSDEGGPKDAMENQHTGIVVESLNTERLARAIDELTDDPSRMHTYGRAARAYAAQRTLKASFDDFWNLHTFSQKTDRTHRERAGV